MTRSPRPDRRVLRTSPVIVILSCIDRRITLPDIQPPLPELVTSDTPVGASRYAGPTADVDIEAGDAAGMGVDDEHAFAGLCGPDSERTVARDRDAADISVSACKCRL